MANCELTKKLCNGNEVKEAIIKQMKDEVKNGRKAEEEGKERRCSEG